MSREIKFQAIHQDYKTGEISFTEWGPVPGGFSSPSSLSNAKLIGHREYTGLKDKNGKEIYEGDLISESGSKPYEVVWQSHSVQWIMKSLSEGRGYREMAYDYAKRDYKVIGNIYENPELLSPLKAPTNEH